MDKDNHIRKHDDEAGRIAEKAQRDLDQIDESTLWEHAPHGIAIEEYGSVQFVGEGITQISGLPNVGSEELLRFTGGQMGMAFNLDPEEVGVIMLDPTNEVQAGDEVFRTGQTLSVPVGEGLLGRVIDPLGRPIDNGGNIQAENYLPIERDSPAVIDRAPVTTPLQTGIKVIDALIPIGRGQRELILGDRQTGKTAITIDTILNQRETGVVCIYCAIGKPASSTARIIAELHDRGALPYCIIVVAPGESTPGIRFIAPYAASSMGEHFRDNGQDALVIYDDLTSHARAYRELSLLLRRAPGREAFPGDIFYIHSRLLERSTHLKPELGGGSLTALPIIETEAQNISAYIPTNVISIADGQIYMTPTLVERAIMPAIDIGRSVSRVGGKAQLAAYRSVVGDLRLAYAQFQELEAFSRFETRLDESTRRSIERGRRVREILKQDQFRPLPIPEQISSLFALTHGVYDDLPINTVAAAERAVQHAVRERHPDLCDRIESGKPLSDEDRKTLLATAREAAAQPKELSKANH